MNGKEDEMLKETPAVRGSTICLVESLPFHPQELTELRDFVIKSLRYLRGVLTYSVRVPSISRFLIRPAGTTKHSNFFLVMAISSSSSVGNVSGSFAHFSNILTGQVKTA
jgi:hypothetical protein